jgi:hypothetical protein
MGGLPLADYENVEHRSGGETLFLISTVIRAGTSDEATRIGAGGPRVSGSRGVKVMARKAQQIAPLRLCDAAEAAIRAVGEAQDAGAPTLYPPDLMGTPHQPECLESFTRHEIDEGCKFLIRLGLLRVSRAGSAPSPE